MKNNRKKKLEELIQEFRLHNRKENKIETLAFSLLRDETIVEIALGHSKNYQEIKDGKPMSEVVLSDDAKKDWESAQIKARELLKNKENGI